MKHSKSHLPKLLSELLIPMLALGFLGIYWWQAIDLSDKAKAFPSIVTVGALLLIAIQTFSAIKGRMTLTGLESQSEGAETRSWLTRALMQRAALLIVTAVIMYFWRDVGATIGIFVFLLSSLFLLGERRPLVLLIFPTVLTVLLAYLFQVVLTVIFPSGFFSLF